MLHLPDLISARSFPFNISRVISYIHLRGGLPVPQGLGQASSQLSMLYPYQIMSLNLLILKIVFLEKNESPLGLLRVAENR